MHLAGVILTLNEERHIQDAIESLRWADEVVVFDSFSTDRTVELAARAGARVMQHRFVDYGAQRNAALDAVDAEWVFFLDADERATPALAGEIRACLDLPQRGWWVPRHNYIFNRLTTGAGWWPDYQLRLLHRASARYDPGRPVHEVVNLQGDAGYLQNPLVHYNYDTVSQFRAKQDRYTRFEAEIRCGAGNLPKPWTYFTGPVRHFWYRYVTLEGWRLGWHGFRLSFLMAYYEAVTWLRVAALRRRSR